MFSEAEFRARAEEWDDVCCHRGYAQTHLGRYELGYTAAARDLMSSYTRNELKVLMLGCSAGQTVMDFLAILHKAIKSACKDVRLKIVALDNNEAAINSARRGFYRPNSQVVVPEAVNNIYDGIPWVTRHDGALFVDWEELARCGHFVDYRMLDIDQGLKRLGEAGFNVVEVCNSHHERRDNDFENIASVTSDDAIVLASSYPVRAAHVLRERILSVMGSIRDPKSLRFMSGLISSEGISKADQLKYAPCTMKMTPLVAATNIQIANMLLELGEEAKQVVDEPEQVKKDFVQNNPLLLTISRMFGGYMGLSSFQEWGFYFFHQTAEASVRRALYAMIKFAHREFVEGEYYPVTALSGELIA